MASGWCLRQKGELPCSLPVEAGPHDGARPMVVLRDSVRACTERSVLVNVIDLRLGEVSFRRSLYDFRASMVGLAPLLIVRKVGSNRV